jgi:hypothetical protein
MPATGKSAARSESALRQMADEDSEMNRMSDQWEDGSSDAAERQGILVALFELIPEVLV